eukprot:6176352-Amphidinium_carterae.2
MTRSLSARSNPLARRMSALYPRNAPPSFGASLSQSLGAEDVTRLRSSEKLADLEWSRQFVARCMSEQK